MTLQYVIIAKYKEIFEMLLIRKKTKAQYPKWLYLHETLCANSLSLSIPLLTFS